MPYPPMEEENSKYKNDEFRLKAIERMRDFLDEIETLINDGDYNPDHPEGPDHNMKEAEAFLDIASECDFTEY